MPLPPPRRRGRPRARRCRRRRPRLTVARRKPRSCRLVGAAGSAVARIIGADNARDERVANHVLLGGGHDRDILEAAQRLERIGEAGAGADRQNDLARVGGADSACTLTPPPPETLPP